MLGGTSCDKTTLKIQGNKVLVSTKGLVNNDVITRFTKGKSNEQ